MSHYSNGDITVDRDFARFGSKSYAINKINTVEVREQLPQRGLPFILILIGVILTLSNLEGSSGNGLLFGVLLVAGGAWLWTKARTKYQLFLMTSSSAVQAYESEDRSEIMQLRYAVEGAMTGR